MKFTTAQTAKKKAVSLAKEAMDTRRSGKQTTKSFGSSLWASKYRGMSLIDQSGESTGNVKGITAQVGPVVADASFGGRGINIGIGFSPKKDKNFSALEYTKSFNKNAPKFGSIKKTLWTP